MIELKNDVNLSEEERRVVELLNASYTTSKIAQLMKIKRKKVNNYITSMRSRGVEIPELDRRKKGYKGAPTRITAEMMEEIEDCATAQSLALNKKFQVTVISGEGYEMLSNLLSRLGL